MMPRFVYCLASYCLLPFVLIRLLFRSLTEPVYASRIRERFGLAMTEELPTNCFWIHAVSKEEVAACAPVIAGLRKKYVDCSIVITTMTPAGGEQVWRLFGASVHHRYLPYDLPGSMRRFVGKLQPRLCVIMERELWPNMIRQCARNNIPCAVLNARLSSRSAAGYRRFPALFSQTFRDLKLVVAQDETIAQRFVQLGLDPGKLRITEHSGAEARPEVLNPAQAWMARIHRQAANDWPTRTAASNREADQQLSYLKDVLTDAA